MDFKITIDHQLGRVSVYSWHGETCIACEIIEYGTGDSKEEVKVMVLSAVEKIKTRYEPKAQMFDDMVGIVEGIRREVGAE